MNIEERIGELPEEVRQAVRDGKALAINAKSRFTEGGIEVRIELDGLKSILYVDMDEVVACDMDKLAFFIQAVPTMYHTALASTLDSLVRDGTFEEGEG